MTSLMGGLKSTVVIGSAASCMSKIDSTQGLIEPNTSALLLATGYCAKTKNQGLTKHNTSALLLATGYCAGKKDGKEE